MTVSNTKSFNEHISTGTETSWPFTFDVSDPAHVKVYVIDLNNVWTDVTASATIDVVSKTVTYGPIDTDYVLRIERVTPATQNVDLNTQGPLLPQVLEDALDKLTYISQEARNLADEVRDTVAKDIKFSGEWTSGTTYKTNQAVTRFGNLYVAKQSHVADSTNAPVDGASNSYWAIAVVKGASLNWKGTWSSGSTYNPNDAVELNGASFICLNAHTADSTNQPGSGSSWTTYWDKIVEVIPADGSITTVKLADSSVTTVKLANSAVTPAKIDSTGSFTMDSLEVTTALTRAGNTVWDDGNFAARIAALVENTTPTGVEYVACDDGKKLKLGGFSKNSNGYQFLPSGLLIQWGNFTPSILGLDTVTFPIAFPNAVFGIYAQTEWITGTSSVPLLRKVDNTQFSLGEASNYDDNWDTGDVIYWLAIGY